MARIVLTTGLLLALTVGWHLESRAGQAILKAPRIGSVMTWQCTGPYSKEYVVKVASVTDGMVRYNGKVDGAKYWADKPANLTGTTLWTHKNGGRVQDVELEDFAGFDELRPGARYKGAVAARDGDVKWVWSYRVAVNRPKTIDNKVLGRRSVIPVVERRQVYHGDYWSKMTSLLEPQLGITIEWFYRDPKGTEHCIMTELAYPDA